MNDDGEDVRGRPFVRSKHGDAPNYLQVCVSDSSVGTAGAVRDGAVSGPDGAPGDIGPGIGGTGDGSLEAGVEGIS